MQVPDFPSLPNNMNDKQKAVYDVAEALGGDVYTCYSGRAMYGRSCMGVVVDDHIEAIEEGARHGLKGAKTDNMGLRTIVYWENVPSIEKDEEEIVEDTMDPIEADAETLRSIGWGEIS